MSDRPTQNGLPGSRPAAQLSLFAGGEMHVLSLEDTITVGRGKGNKVRLRDDLISRRHCRIFPSGQGFSLEDLGSRNGTWLNGARVENSPLKPGDVIDIGRCTLFYSVTEKQTSFDVKVAALRDAALTGAGSPTVMGIETARVTRESFVPMDELAAILRDRNNYIHLQQISKVINSETDPGKLFEKIIDSAVELTRARRGFLLRPEGRGYGIVIARTRGLEPEPSEKDLDAGVVQKALGDGAAFRGTIRVKKSDFSVLCVPCLFNEEVVGALYLDAPKRETTFSEEDEKIITTFSEQVAIAVENVRHRREMKEKRALEKEIEIAGTIQRRLFPPGAPDVPGIEVFGESVPATEVGGDYYDFIPSEDGRSLTLCIADVSGKGVSAGLIMVMARSILRSLTASSTDTRENLISLNRTLSPDLENGRFISMILMYWDGDRKVLRYTGAGHEHLLLYKAATRRCAKTPAGGAVLGIPWQEVGAHFEEKEIVLEPGDQVLLYTDGVTDARNARGEFFGLKRLQRIVETQGSLQPGQLVYTILEKVASFMGDTDQNDDITLLALQKKTE